MPKATAMYIVKPDSDSPEKKTLVVDVPHRSGRGVAMDAIELVPTNARLENVDLDYGDGGAFMLESGRGDI